VPIATRDFPRASSLVRPTPAHLPVERVEARPAPASGVHHAAIDVEAAERELVARLQLGEEAAYETLVRSHGPRMLALARRYFATQDDAEDVLQSAFVLVFRFIGRFEGQSRLSTWLHRIVVNCSLMRIRTRARHPEVLFHLGDLENSCVSGAFRGKSSLDELVHRETRERVRAAVDRLPDSVRPAVALCALGGVSLSDSSRLIGAPRTAVKAALGRGRTALRTMLATRTPTRRSSPRGSVPPLARAGPARRRSRSRGRSVAGAT
jgi:RNA polymerase sigma-70 factor (ECF subfamily)